MFPLLIVGQAPASPPKSGLAPPPSIQKRVSDLEANFKALEDVFNQSETRHIDENNFQLDAIFKAMVELPAEKADRGKWAYIDTSDLEGYANFRTNEELPMFPCFKGLDPYLDGFKVKI